MDAKEAERLLLAFGFLLQRTKGSHRIYFKEKKESLFHFIREKVFTLKL
jgi:predicted RNA binding protein YcfA (HicA-like mRNA interferase family)